MDDFFTLRMVLGANISAPFRGEASLPGIASTAFVSLFLFAIS